MLSVPWRRQAGAVELHRCDLGAARPLRCGTIVRAAAPRRPVAGDDQDRLRRPPPRRSQPALAGHGDRRRRRARLQLDRGALRRARSTALLGAAAAPPRRSSSSTSGAPGLSEAIDCTALQSGPGPGIHRDRGVRRPARRRATPPTRPAEAAADIDAVRARARPRPGLLLRRLLRDAARPGLRGPLPAARCAASSSTPPIPADDPYYRTLYPAGVRGAARSPAAARRTAPGDPVGRFRRVVRRFHAAGRSTEGLLAFLLGAGTLAPRSYLSLDDADRRFLRGEPRRLEPADRTRTGRPRRRSANSHTGSRSRSSATTTRCSGTPTRRPPSGSASSRPRSCGLPPRLLRALQPPRVPALLGRPPDQLPELAGAAAGRAGAAGPGRLAGADARSRPWSSPASSTTSPRSRRRARSAARFPRSRLYVVPNRGHASSIYFPFTLAGGRRDPRLHPRSTSRRPPAVRRSRHPVEIREPRGSKCPTES